MAAAVVATAVAAVDTMTAAGKGFLLLDTHCEVFYWKSNMISIDFFHLPLQVRWRIRRRRLRRWSWRVSDLPMIGLIYSKNTVLFDKDLV